MALLNRLSVTILALAALGAATSGCDDTATSASTAAGGSTSASTGSGSMTTSTGTAGSTSSGMTIACDPPEGTPSAAKNLAFTSAKGTITDAQDMPVVDLFLQLCGKNICLNGKTATGGTYAIPGDGSNMDRPFLKAGDGLAFAKVGFPVPAADSTVDGVTAKFVDSMTELKSGATATADDVSIVLAAMTGVAFDITIPEEPASHTFRAALIPTTKTEAFAPGQAFSMVVALGPTETLLCPPAKLTVPNDASLAAGAAVDFYFQELSIEESFGTYGEWTKVASGAVSADGMTISTADASGIPVLGVYAIKPAN